MLSVEDRFMIKDMYRRGMTISDIARTTGHDRKTVRTALNGPVSPPPPRRKLRTKKLDPFVPYLDRRIQEGVLNCNKLWDEIRKQGYEGGKSLIKSFVHPYREARRQDATMRFETPPGEQAQVDWSHFGFIEHYGCRRRLYAFVMTLGWSRASYLEFTVSADAAWWLRCHLHAFHYFGGVPKVVLHDNLKTAVLERHADGTIHWNPRYRSAELTPKPRSRRLLRLLSPGLSALPGPDQGQSGERHQVRARQLLARPAVRRPRGSEPSGTGVARRDGQCARSRYDG